MNRAYRLALFCGACPLVVGVSIFLLWLVTRWEWLVLAGMYAILGGCVVFLIGSFALLRAHWFAAHDPGVPKRKLWRSTLVCAGLLLSNFVVAGAIIACVLAAEGWLGGEHQIQQLAHVDVAQRLKFHVRDARHLSGVTLRVRGHINGMAKINGPLSETRQRPIAGDVDVLTGGDWFEPIIEFEYLPTNVTSGQLTFELEFH